MVLESLVSDLLNRFIGDYVENLDKSQLKIGIWGGNVVLENLRVKENALRVYRCFLWFLGKLTLKIPLKNLYTEAVVATLDGLYLLVVPGASEYCFSVFNLSIKYDAVKEERYQQEAKQKELQRIEEALQIAARKDKGRKHKKHKKTFRRCKKHEQKSEKAQEEKKDTFAEKLATQVIKNLQVKVTSIHIRYEDDVSDPSRPVSMGVTLSELSLQTTDESWRACILNEAAKIIYKLGRLECLCAYWNVNSPIFYRGSWEEIVDKLKAGISTRDEDLKGYQYIFRPIFASAKMCINPNSEIELKSPKINLQLEVQNIAIEMTRPQYLSMVDLLESVDSMVKNAPYRKFRPDVPVHKHAKQWWLYGINSVLEVHIRRFNRMWSWSNIWKHRQTLKAYKAAYKSKLTQGKVREDTDKQIQELEKSLDVFNITLARQQAQMEVVRSGQKVVGKKVAAQKQGGGGGGFFSSFFGRKEGKKKEQEEEHRESESIDAIMTTEEKSKLYTAIGYSESSHNLALPKSYVAVKINFKLLRTSVTVREEANVPEILKIQMIDLSTTISQRPGAQAIKVEASLEHWYVTGLQQQGAVPSLIASVGASDSSLLSVLFEINPEESSADQLLRVHSQPVEIIYDALTVNSLVEFFKAGKGVDLEVITSATLSKLEEIKEKTASGLSHIIETRKVLDLRIDLKPSYLLIPKSGFYHSNSDLMIIDFGSLHLSSVDQAAHQLGSSFSSLEEIMDRAYERFSLELRSVQVLYSKSGAHQITVQSLRSVENRIKTKVLPELSTDRCLVQKIKDQVFKGPNGLEDAKNIHSIRLAMWITLRDNRSRKFFRLGFRSPLAGKVRNSSSWQLKEDVPAPTFAAWRTSSTFAPRPKENLEGASISNEPLHLIRSSDKHESDLLKVEYTKADVSGPSFQTLFDSTEQTLKVEFSSLDFLLHTKALLSSINYLNSALPHRLTASKDPDTRRHAHPATAGKTVSKGSKDSVVVSFKLYAMLGSFGVIVCDDRSSIANIQIKGVDASVVVQTKETEVFARLRDIVVMDVDPKTIHKKVVSIVGEEVFSFKMSLYPGATEGDGYCDTARVDSRVTLRLGCIQITYLHKFLTSLMTFVDNFQTAKEALSAATAQAAEKAASSVRDFAQKSFRLSLNIRLKAPLIIIPQSSTSHNAFVVDLGLITVSNSFSLLPAEGFPLPAVMETMDINLTHLKLCRYCHQRPQSEVELLQPINLELLVKRNLAASWFTSIPGVEVTGVLKSMNISLGQEDLVVLMSILAENIGEGSRTMSPDLKKPAIEGKINLLICKVTLTLKKLKKESECAFLVLQAAQLGVHTKVHKYDMQATTYIKTISMKCLEFTDACGDPLCILSSSAEAGAELLKVEYVKVCPPYVTLSPSNNQSLVQFSSLDLMLHTEALLSTMDFLSAALSSSSSPSPERETRRSDDSRTSSARSTVVSSPSDGDVTDLKIDMQLGAFNVLVCDQRCNIADIRIQGLHGSLLMQGTQTCILARLRDFIIINVDPKTIHKKAISIVGDEVFSFSMSLTPKATEGVGYTDTSKVDGRVKLNVGCIQVVYLHKFVMSLLNFSNHFQTAKEALSAATAQAAVKAVSSVRDFAQKSFRLSLNIRLKAPLIIIPQSSTSNNAVEADLGLITVSNSFSLLPVDNCPLPAVIDNMDVQLTQLKLSRYQSSLEIPILLELKKKMDCYCNVALSQDDLTVLLKILMENIGEAGSVQPPSSSDSAYRQTAVPIRTRLGVHSESVCLGEFRLCEMRAAGKMFSNGNLEVSTVLSACTLDDRRSGIQRVTSRMLGKRDEDSADAMIDVTYSQSGGERSVIAVLQKLYLCGSVEFLMAVGEFFLQALPKTQPPAPALPPAPAPDKPSLLPFKHVSEQKINSGAKTAPGQKMVLRMVVVDPEVVFVANLMKADAPALVASFQCDFRFDSQEETQLMKANVKDFKVLACPFIRTKDNQPVLRPCSVVLETRMSDSSPLTGSVTVEEVIIKVSPIILNTVLTITAAMTPRAPEERGTAAAPETLSSLWSVRNIYTCNYWFLGVETAAEVTESFCEVDGGKEGESFRAEVKVVQVTLESGQGHRTIPLLLAESSITACARNWSSTLSLAADITLEVNYFNEAHAVWEPLIERVESGKRRWNLTVQMKNNPVREKSPVPGDDFVMLPDPRTGINICSKDTMNITLSKCCLNVLHNLAQVLHPPPPPSHHPKPPTHPSAQPSTNSLLNSTSIISGVLSCLSCCWSSFTASTSSSVSSAEKSLLDTSSYSEISGIPVDKPGRRLYNVRKPGLEESVSVLLQINASEGNKVITVRSPLQIKNHFSVPFSILKYSPELGGLVNVGVAEPEKESHVTLDSYRCQLFVLPVGCLEGQYRQSTTCIAWKEQVHVSSEVRSVLQCPAHDSSFLPLVVNTLAVPDDLSHITSHGEGDWDPAYVIHLHPPVTVRNLLPYSIRYLLEGSADFQELQEGGTADVLNASISGEIMELVLVKYQGRNWNSHVKISPDVPEFFPVCFTSDSSEQLTVDVCLHVSRAAGRMVLSVFSPYWIINKTSRVLQYRAEDTYVKHPSDFRDVILFSFRKKNIFSKNKLQLCVSTSSWSEGFSLDTVGSYGCVRCPDKTMDYLVGVSIQMSSFNLTRIVTMSPFYTLVNKSSFELEVGEVQNDMGNGNVSGKWHYISSKECLPLWPESGTGKLCVRVVGSESASKSFFFNKQDNGTLLSMEQFGGIIVDVNISDHSTVISFTDYYDGAAPALLVNHTPWVTISFRQSGCEASRELNPGEAQRFAWDDPAGVRKLCWTCQGHSGELDLIKDECGQFACDSLAQVHWVSFLDGRQRVLLFTEDVAVVTKARQAEELEQIQQEIIISLQNLGLSLINNHNRHEIAYIGITSSGVVWEMRPKNRWKSFNRKNISLLEKSYQNHLSGKTAPGWITLETGLEVNFARVPMQMRLPYSSPIRRNFLSGIHMELKQSPHQRSLRAQLHWLQVDNQLTGAIFPIVFHPVHPPKSIALDSEPKPFIDVSIITRFNEHSQVMQFKYFMVLVQEMAVKIDQGFLGAIFSLFTSPAQSQPDKQKMKLIDRDLEALQAQLMESSITDASGLSFFEHFHISPIKLHLSLSLGSSGDESEDGDMVAIQSLNLLLKSIGATLTDVDDLIFKLAFFEVKYQFYRREKLMWAVIGHYTEQFLKQMYVLVLGLDVLGNPFGLIRGLSEGVEAFFYEPFQGAVQGPEEFAEGFVIGVRSLLGHTVGGAAGMVSRITGSVGKGLAAITMDKEYQQKRREEMNRPPRDFGESLAKGGKGLLKGVVGGVTGIVTKPVEGAKKEGAAGFFKGIGKGLVGVVARPTGGIVDMASSTFQGIQRVAESTEEVTKLRPVRLIREDGIIRPYDQQESEGYDLFQPEEEEEG
uniref:Vacuolar protein sorting 13 homolog C n=1 Tax=Astyanax mexicanus TaxID=7994 RepID=A0A3B1JJN7_ASTMX